jgi:CheY-like chemotaxis protein
VSLFFSVKDTGIGISKDAQAKLFREFMQSDKSITREYGGTGLGLAISKNLTQLMGGKIIVESELGIGSEFMFELKFGHKEKETNMFEDQEIKPPSNLSILVAEDNPINQKVVMLTLRMMGLSCDIAKNGIEAFEMYKKDRYQVILMDMQMPVLDGVSATEKIRSFEVSETIEEPTYIIALTANAFIEDKQRCIEAGMNDFLSKPFKEDGLRKILNQASKSIAL